MFRVFVQGELVKFGSMLSWTSQTDIVVVYQRKKQVIPVCSSVPYLLPVCELEISGLFVRMLLHVLGRMGSYIVLLIIYLTGFATALSILIQTLRKEYSNQCSQISDTAKSDRFHTPVVSWLSTYMTMMASLGWESTTLYNSSSNILYLILICVFI